MFQLLLSRTYRGKAFPVSHMAAAVRSWRGTTNREGTQQTSADPRDTPQHMASGSLHRGGGRRKSIQSNGTYLPMTPLCVVVPCFPQDGGTPTCPQRVVNGFLHLLHFWGQLLLYFLSLPQPTSSPFCSSDPLHHPTKDGVSKRLCGTKFPAGLKPGQLKTGSACY